MTYSINDDIYETVTTSGLTDKHELAAKIAESVPSKQLRATVEALLPQHVLNVQSRVRGAVFAPRTGAEQRELTTTGRAARLRAMSAKDMVVHVPRDGSEHESMRLGDCTVDDLDAIACSYTQRAVDNRAFAAKYRKLAGVLSSAGVVRVDELPDADLRKALA